MTGWDDCHTIDSGKLVMVLRARRDPTGMFPRVHPAGPPPPRRRRWLDGLGVGVSLLAVVLAEIVRGR